MVGGYCALFCGSQDGFGLPSRGSKMAALLLFLGSGSIKPLTLVGTLVAAIYCKQSRKPKSLATIALYLLPFVLLLGLWSLHSYHLTGQFFGYDKGSIELVRSESDPGWVTGTAAGRIPKLKDFVVLPTVPLVTGIIGQREPYGGRTGLIIVPFCAIAIFNLRRLSQVSRKNVIWLLIAALTYFFLLGPVFIKTRFHIFVWTLLMCVASAGYALTREWSPKLRRITTVTYCLLVLLGMLDSARYLPALPPPNIRKLEVCEPTLQRTCVKLGADGWRSSSHAGAQRIMTRTTL